MESPFPVPTTETLLLAYLGHFAAVFAAIVNAFGSEIPAHQLSMLNNQFLALGAGLNLRINAIEDAAQPTVTL